mmetsp:Transcript_850/g.2378  ORF Transcript_850/g.2378 Transcript_850/m.2378 type:complete len:135 (-) Transcript_850:1068-1472(-)
MQYSAIVFGLRGGDGLAGGRGEAGMEGVEGDVAVSSSNHQGSGDEGCRDCSSAPPTPSSATSPSWRASERCIAIICLPSGRSESVERPRLRRLGSVGPSSATKFPKTGSNWHHTRMAKSAINPCIGIMNQIKKE